MCAKTICLTIVMIGFQFSEIARGDDVFWDGETSSDWQTGTNWQPQCSGMFCVQSPPGQGDRAVLLDAVPIGGSTLARLSDDVDIAGLTIGGGITVNTGGYKLSAGSDTHVSGNGSALIVPDAPDSVQAFFSYALNVLDGGRVELGGLGQPGADFELGGPENDVGLGGTLSGNGRVRFYNDQGTPNSTVLKNDGTIRALNGTLSLESAAGGGGKFDLDGSNEEGVLDVDDGSFLSTNVTLNVLRPLADPFNGTIEIGQGDRAHFSHRWQLGSEVNVSGTIRMNGDDGVATLSGERVTIAPSSGAFAAPITVFSGTGRFETDLVMENGVFIVHENATVHFKGVTNLGPGAALLGFDHYDLIVDNRVDLNQPNLDWDSPSPGSHDTIINRDGHLVLNNNQINSGDDDNMFRGTVEINGGRLSVNTPTIWRLDGRMVLRHTDGAPAVVDGTTFFVGDGFDTSNVPQLTVTGPGASRIDSAVTFRSDAEVEIDDGAELTLLDISAFLSGVDVNGPGRIVNRGDMRFGDGVEIGAPVVNSGIVSMGGVNLITDLTVAEYDQAPASGPEGQLDLKLQSATPGDFDQLIVTGDAVLGGTLSVDWLGLQFPSRGDQFPIITAASISGMFELLLLPPVIDGDAWNIQYSPTSVILEVVPEGLPGDYNQNNTVDAADYTVWRDNLGSPTALPNDDTPGVGPDDYTRWKTNFGQSAGSGSAVSGSSRGSGATVPEPSTVALLASMAFGCFGRSRKLQPSERRQRKAGRSVRQSNST